MSRTPTPHSEMSNSTSFALGAPAPRRWFPAVGILLSLALLAWPAMADLQLGGSTVGIGLAKNAQSEGREVTLDFYVENFGSDVLSDISVLDDLDATFGAGNYQLLFTPELREGPPTFSVNNAFDGSIDTNLVAAGSSLGSGETAVIRIVVEITAIVDVGNGLGVYLNQASGDGLVLGVGTNDLSDSGTNPDPNDNQDPGDADEDDPTLIDLLANPIIGVSKTATVSGMQVTLDFFLENFGNRNLTNVSLPDDLDAVFGAGNYTVSAAPTFVDDPGTLTLNGAFDGSGDQDLISGGSLAIGDTAQLRVVVDVTNVTDQGFGLGIYRNQVQVVGTVEDGQTGFDLSDAGSEPDPNGNGNPNEEGENDATVFAIGEMPVIGVAKQATVINSTVTLDFYLENLGDVELSNLALEDDLDAAFGVGNYVVTAPTLVDDPGTLTLNPDYDGSEDTALLLAPSTLAIGDTAQVQVVVTVTVLADVGSGLGVYSNQALASGFGPSGGRSDDASDNGTDPDSNGNGDPGESGEDDPTPITVGELPLLGVAKDVVVGGVIFANINVGGVPTNAFGTRVVIRLRVQNLGNVTVANIDLTDDLNAVFGAGNYGTVTSNSFPSVVLSGAGNISPNTSGYNGSTNINVLNPGASSLAPGSLAEITFEVVVTSVTDQGSGLGVYANQAIVNGNSTPANTSIMDLSGPGDVVDPDGNGDPTNGNEDDPTQFIINSFIGAAKAASVTNRDVTFDLFIETFGGNAFTDVSLTDDLDGVFGAGNYSILSPPALIDDPGTLVLNPGFDGSGDNELLGPGSTMNAADTAQIQFVVRVDTLVNSGAGLGSYTNQTTVEGTLPNGQTTFDLSETGTDPDPGGDDNPATFGAENTPTSFTVAADAIVGAAKTAMVSGTAVTFDIYLEGFGAGTVTELVLTDDLDAVFGAGNYTITSAPSLIVDPGTLVLNGAYDGSAVTDLLAAGSTLMAGATAQLQMVVTVDTITDQGAGFGIYSNQVQVTGLTPDGFVLTDLSDEGTDPDSNGDDDPTLPRLDDPPVDGEDDPTDIVVTEIGLGAALHSFVSGNEITYDFYIENLGETEITNIAINLSLLGEFGFGNYTVVQTPVLLDGPATVSPNASFEGTFSTSLLFGGVLQAGESARIRFAIDVTNTVNGPDYSVQFLVSGMDVLGNTVIDNSDDGIRTDPNGNGEPTDAGENDPTLSILGEESILGVSKTAAALGTSVTFDVFVENLGNVLLSDVTLEDSIDDVFGSGNYSITAPPSLIDDPGTFVLNGSWNGSGDTALLGAGSTLAAGDTAQLQFVVDVTNLVDVGNGIGLYENQVFAASVGPSATVAQDLSDDGGDPDPNGNDNPADAGEGDATSIAIGNVSVGVAKNATVNGNRVDLDFVVENFGSVTLSNFSLVDDLDAVFGAGNYLLLGPPTLVSAPRNLVLNGNFDGSSDTQLIAEGTQDPGIVEQIRVSLLVTEVTDQGLGGGFYSNQVTVMAQAPDTTPTSDLSDAGLDPDPNGNDRPDDSGEDDPTLFQVTGNPVVGIAKTAAVTDRTVIFDLFLEGLGNVDAAQLSLTDNLDGVFGAGNYTITAPPALIVDPGTLVLAPYDGSGNDGLLAVGSSLAQGATAQIRFTVEVTTVSDQGLGLGMFENQATGSATGPFGGVAVDLSDSGTDADPDGNGNPAEAGNDDPTVFMLAGSIGDLVWHDIDDNGVQNGSEPGLSGITVFLDLNTNGAFDEGEPSDVTDGFGAYSFTNVAAGSYTVAVDPTGLPTGFIASTTEPLAVTLFAGEQLQTVDFGYRAQAALTITKVDDVDPVTAGNGLVYTLEVTNDGPSDTTGVRVVDLLPPGVSVIANTGGCLVDPADLGGLRSILSPAEVVPPAASTASGSASFILDTSTNIVRYAVHVSDIDNIIAAEIRAGGPGVDGLLEYFLYLGDPVFDPTRPITGTLQLTEAEAMELVTDPLYVNVRTSDFPSGEMRGQIEVTTSSIVSCDLGDLVDGDSTSFDISVDVDADVAAGSVLSNVAVATSDGIDPDETATPNGLIFGSTVLEETAVETQADLSITKVDSADPVVAGTSYSYTVEVSNAGPSDAQNVVVTDTLPSGVTFLSTVGCAEDPNGVPTCTLGTVPASGSASFTVNVSADSATIGTVTNQVSVAGDTDDPQAANDTASETTEIIAVADLAVTLTDSPDPVVAGTTLTLTAEVTNNGPSVATGVNVATTLPSGVTLVSTSGCTNDPSAVPNCQLPDLASGDSAGFDIQVTVDTDTTGSISTTVQVSSAVTDNVNGNDSATELTQVVAEADLAITKTDSVDPVVAGSPLIYTLEVTNGGPSDATNVVITENLPGDVTVVSTSGCDEDPGGTPTCTLGTLAAGDSAQVLVEVTVDSDTAGPLSNEASVASDTVDPNALDNTANEITAVVAEADLSITLTDSPDPVAAGTNLTYTVEVTNNGPSLASTVEVATNLPTEVTFVATSGCDNDVAGVPTCQLGDLGAGLTTSFDIEVTVPDDVGGTITAEVTVSSSTTDTDGSNDTASEDTEVIAVADLAITKMDSADPVVAGTNFTYTLEVTNNGPSVAENVSVVDNLPAEVTLVASTGCDEDPVGAPTCSLGTLEVGNSVSFTLEVTANDDAVGVITNNAGVSSDALDPDDGNDTASETTTVTAEADVAVSLSDAPDPAAAGGSLVFTVEVTNVGPSVASGVEVTTTLPPELSAVATTGCTNDPSGFPVCQLPNVAVNGSVSFELETAVDAGAPSGTITTTVDVTTAADDPDDSNDTASEDTLLDDVAPTVTNLNSEADTGDGVLEECEEVRDAVHQLILTFSESLFDPDGDSDADDVTNPANYQLIAAGADGDLSTEVCGAPLGDDVILPLGGVTYDDGDLTATLSLVGNQTLGNEVYRLLACGSTTLRDIAGNALDGDGDGTGGDDFLRTFRVERVNLLRNGHFDCDLASWVPVSTVPEEIAYSSEDFDDASVSGSAGYTNLSASQDFALGQCVAVPANRSCVWNLGFRLDTGAETLLSATRTCEVFDGADCTGNSLATETSSSFHGDTGGLWLQQELTAATPNGAASMLCSFDLRTDDGADFDAFLDEAILTCPEEFLFNDGFESGDTSAWSNAIP